MELESSRTRSASSVVMAHPVTYFAVRVHEVIDEVTMASTAGLSGEAAGEAAVQLARAEARLAACGCGSWTRLTGLTSARGRRPRRPGGGRTRRRPTGLAPGGTSSWQGG